MVRNGLLVVTLLIMTAAEGAIPPPQPCCYVWAIEGQKSAVILKDGRLLRFRAAPSLIRTIREGDPFFKINGVFDPGSSITLHRFGSWGPRGWVPRDIDVRVTLEDYLPPATACCVVESFVPKIDPYSSVLTVRRLDGKARHEAWANEQRGTVLPPVELGQSATVVAKARYLLVRVGEPGRTYVLEILPPIVTAGEKPGGARKIGAVHSHVEMKRVGFDGLSSRMLYDEEGARRSALRQLQIEALRKQAVGVIVTGCRVNEAHPSEFLCEGEALGPTKGKR